MELWGWLLIGLVVALVLLWAGVQWFRERHRPVDPAHVLRDPAERRVNQSALRRIKDVERDLEPGL
jgi:hypothetical protein